MSNIDDLSRELSKVLNELPPRWRGRRFSESYYQAIRDAEEKEEKIALYEEHIKELEEAYWSGQRLYTYAIVLSIQVHRLYRNIDDNNANALFLACHEYLEKLKRAKRTFRKEAWDIGRNQQEMPQISPSLDFRFENQRKLIAENRLSEFLHWACLGVDDFAFEVNDELLNIKDELDETRLAFDELLGLLPTSLKNNHPR